MGKTLRSIRDVYRKFNVILDSNQKKWGVVVFLLSILGALAETLGVSVILPLVQAMIEPEQLLSIKVVADLCSILQIDTSKNLLVIVTFSVVLVYILKNVYLCFLSWVRVKYTSKIQRELSIRMLHSYMKRGYSFFRKTNTAILLRGTTESVVAVYNVILMFMKILAEILTILCIFILMIYTDWTMALSMVFLVGVCLVVIVTIFRKIMKKAGNIYYAGAGEVNRASLQLFNGIKEILVFNRKNYFVKKYEESFIKMQTGRIRQNVATEIPAYIIEGSCVTGIIVAVFIRVNLVENAADFIPQLAVFAMSAFRLLPSVGRITSNVNVCMFSLPAVSEVYENVLEARAYEKKMLREKELGEVTFLAEKENNSFKENLIVDNIVWKYPDGEENVLDHVSLKIEKGQAVAFVGPSGAGKSTLADIILGLFQPQEGTILIDGVDVRCQKGLERIISFVPQSVYLIDDTIRRNIAFGIPEQEISDELVWNALEQAQMKGYVLQLPEGIDTIVGERGVRFSGGQMQRLAIARALYKDPDILVLDEATSALDSETEKAVMESIEALQGHKTLIIIAHRLSTIQKCDKIFEISNGVAVEKRYEELNK